ncbi:MAG: FapA family protein, partial [bacterium]|nr:FapA family protein [bacterium]
MKRKVMVMNKNEMDFHPPSPDSPDENMPNLSLGDGLTLTLAPDHMHATLEVDVLHAEQYTPEIVLEFLQRNGIKMDHALPEAIQSIFEKNLYNQKVTVAEGMPPIAGEDGSIDWAIDLSILDGSQLVEKKGRINFKDRHHVLQVNEDQLLAQLLPPTDGAYGKTILGEDLAPTPGKPAKFPAGKGIRISEDGTEMTAALSGVVCKDGEKVSISPTYTVQGNVSFKTGNINFDESVIITGEVMTDFKVRAGQDLHISGLVEGAILDVGGNLFIDGGVQGDDKAKIKAGGDITVKFINNATVEANGNIYVNGPITQSTVIAKGKIILDESKGVIQGGYVAADEQILATIIGSELGVKTQIELCRQVSIFRKKSKTIED